MQGDPKNLLKVGAFVAFGLVLLMVSILLIGGDKMLFSRMYTLTARFPEVQGMARGSVVSLSGLIVGNVSRIEIDRRENSVLVEMRIQQRFQDRITIETTASVRTQGALGDKYIYLEPGPAGATPLEDGASIKVESSPGLLDWLATEGNQLETIVEVIKEARDLLRSINEGGRARELVKNFSQAGENLNRVLTETHHILKDLRGPGGSASRPSEAMKNLASILKKIDSGEGTLGALINEPELHRRLLRLLGEPSRSQYLKPLIRSSIETHEKAQ